MSPDPLADLLVDREGFLIVSPKAVAEVLRANRDRVLEALGGEQGVYDLEVLGPTILWLFPEGSGE